MRLLLTHPLRWQGERSRWEDDRDRAAMPPTMGLTTGQ
jgi:hypothetical protein